MRPTPGHGLFSPALVGLTLVGSVVALAVLGAAASVEAALPAEGQTQLVSAVDTNPQSGAGVGPIAPSVSANGRFVVFVSSAKTLTSSDGHGHAQVYEYDTQSDTTRLVSVSQAGANDGANDSSFDPTVSADGRFVAFSSTATDLVSAASGGHAQAYVRDLVSGTTTLVSATAAAVGADNDSLKPVISADGSAVAYTSQATDLSSVPTDGYVQAYRRILAGSASQLVSLETTGTRGGNGDVSTQVAISGDGGRIAFASGASNLTAEPSGTHNQVYLRDATAATTRMISLNSAGTGGADADSAYPVLSADGSVVAFTSLATNLTAASNHSHVQVYTRQIPAGTTTLVSQSSDGTMSGANGDSGGATGTAISADGSQVVFGSTATDISGGNTHLQVLETNLSSGNVGLVSSRAGTTTPGNNDSALPSISADGSAVVFLSAATDLTAGSATGAFNVYGNFGGALRLVSHNGAIPVFGDDASDTSAISADGHYIVFESKATNLTTHDSKGYSQIYRRDLISGATTLVSSSLTGAGANGSSQHPSISADGRFVAFDSDATDLATTRATGHTQVWLRDMSTGVVTLVSSSDPTTPTAGDADSVLPTVSGSGNAVVFLSSASHLTSQTANAHAQVYEWSASSHAIDLVSIDHTQTVVGDDDSTGAPVVSADGDFVAFASNATNLGTIDTHSATQVYVRQLSAHSTQLVSQTTGRTASAQGAAYPAISADGVHIAFASVSAQLTADDPMGHAQVYSRDIVQRTTTMVSVSSSGEVGDADAAPTTLSVSANGAVVAFASTATNLTPGLTTHIAQTFVRALPSGTTTLVSQKFGAQAMAANDISLMPAISADARFVAFTSVATDVIELVPSAKPQVYVRNVSATVIPTTPPPTEPPTSPPPTGTGGTGPTTGGTGTTSGTGSSHGGGASQLAQTGHTPATVPVAFAFGVLAVGVGGIVMLRRTRRRSPGGR